MKAVNKLPKPSHKEMRLNIDKGVGEGTLYWTCKLFLFFACSFGNHQVYCN